jgi:hypothetical protein
VDVQVIQPSVKILAKKTKKGDYRERHWAKKFQKIQKRGLLGESMWRTCEVTSGKGKGWHWGIKGSSLARCVAITAKSDTKCITTRTEMCLKSRCAI